MHRNLLFALVMVLAAALVLSACGGQATQPATQPPDAQPAATQAPAVTEAENTAVPQEEMTEYPAPVVQQSSAPYPMAGTDSGAALDGLLASLKDVGLQTTTGDDVSQDFFSVPGKVLMLGGDELQVYEYQTPEAALAEASTVSADGSSVGTSMVDWINTPHFFRSGNLIVIYVGQNQDVLQVLQSLAGTQFAGG